MPAPAPAWRGTWRARRPRCNMNQLRCYKANDTHFEYVKALPCMWLRAYLAGDCACLCYAFTLGTHRVGLYMSAKAKLATLSVTSHGVRCSLVVMHTKKAGLRACKLHSATACLVETRTNHADHSDSLLLLCVCVCVCVCRHGLQVHHEHVRDCG